MLGQLFFSSPGSPVLKLKKALQVENYEKVLPKDLPGYMLCEYTDENKRVFCILQPLVSGYKPFFILKDLTEPATEYECVISVPKTIH